MKTVTSAFHEPSSSRQSGSWEVREHPLQVVGGGREPRKDLLSPLLYVRGVLAQLHCVDGHSLHG
eukprot:6755112-Pyramimonas_sp.AAC.1